MINIKAQSTANWHNTHTHMDRAHSLSHFTSTQLQPRGMKRQLSYYFSVHAGCFRVYVIHQTLTWTTTLTCICYHSCAYVYTWGLGTPAENQHKILDLKKFRNLSCAPDRIWTFLLWIWSPTLYQLSQPVTPWNWTKKTASMSDPWTTRSSFPGCLGTINHDITMGKHQNIVHTAKTGCRCSWCRYGPFPFQGFYTSSSPFLYCYVWGVQPAKCEEDWGRGVLDWLIDCFKSS